MGKKKIVKELVKGITAEEYCSSNIVGIRLAEIMKDERKFAEIKAIGIDKLTHKADEYFAKAKDSMSFSNGLSTETLHDIEDILGGIIEDHYGETAEFFKKEVDCIYNQFNVPDVFRKEVVREDKAISSLDELKELEGFQIIFCAGDDETEAVLNLHNMETGDEIILLLDAAVFTHRRMRIVGELELEKKGTE